MITLTAKRSQGFSLIELMVAMVLGLVLMGGVIQVFLTSKQSYAYNEELGWIQENSRFALEYMTRDLRMAGYFGCSTEVPVVNTLNPIGGTGWQTAFGNGINGYDGEDTSNVAFTGAEFPQPARPAVTSGTVPRSDVVTLSKLDTSQSFSVTGHNAVSANITIGAHPFVTGDILVVSDCRQAAIFQHAGSNTGKVVHNTGTGTPGNCTGDLGAGSPTGCPNGGTLTYGDDALVSKAVSFAYYVDVATNGLPALYVQELDHDASTTATELVQGIENLQALYGEDITGDGFANRYINADDVSDWTAVVTTKIYLLSRSLVESASEPQTFSFMGTNYTPTDRYLRQEFVSTVQIRNRG
jgi:type IV pilus assembly protein PilW